MGTRYRVNVCCGDNYLPVCNNIYFRASLSTAETGDLLGNLKENKGFSLTFVLRAGKGAQSEIS